MAEYPAQHCLEAVLHLLDGADFVSTARKYNMSYRYLSALRSGAVMPSIRREAIALFDA